MKKVRKKKRARPSKSGKTVAIASPASLPPQGSVSLVPASIPKVGTAVPTVGDTPPDKPYWLIERGSKVHQMAMRILAMRATGLDDKGISEQLDIKVQTIKNYIHMAQRSGLLSDGFLQARDQLEYAIVPKALRNISRALDDKNRHSTSGMTVGDQVALKIAEGTVFKEFDNVAATYAPSTTIGINLVMPPGPPQQMREGAIGGTPAYVEAEVVGDVGTR